MQAPAAGSGCACPAAAESVYIWGLAEEVELRTPGGRRDQRSLFAPTPLGPRIKQDPHRPPPPLHTPPPTPFHLRAGLGEWRARSASQSLRTVWRWQPRCHPRLPWPVGAALVAALGSSARRIETCSRESTLRTTEEEGTHSRKCWRLFLARKYSFPLEVLMLLGTDASHIFLA